MKNLIRMILFISLVWAEESVISLDYSTLQYGGDDYHLLSINGNWKNRLSFLDGDLDLRSSIRFHQNVCTSKDKNSSSIIDDNRAIIDSLSLDYYVTNHILLSLGRQAMSLNLLNGSFDGILFAGEYDSLNVKFFYFRHYTALQPTYYENYILKNLYGTNITYTNNGIDSEITAFSNGDNSVTSIYLSYSKYSIMLGAEHLRFYSSSSLFDDEASYKLFLAYKHKAFLIKSGIYDVYQGSLKHVYGLGSSEFKAFPLSSFLNQKNAKNIYVDLEYNYSHYYSKIHVGKTRFDKKNKSYVGKELGVTLGVRYENYDLSSAFLTQKSDALVYSTKRTTWLQINLKYRF